MESRIKGLIELSKYNRQQIMDIMKVSETTLSNWSTGKSVPSLKKAFKLARLLGVTVEELYNYTDEDE
ncbi:helix-turn-helix transcriptional regulator [Niallia sp. RD1]|uniref:helix-turn-helix transcriptional regulator n=1 Tax=Niallia sp. RD1 TaxID=2962858 RepID=UPI0020C1B643|nr:helix-turn-helix domain-containing protein [Niallia sp. RD1]UTI41138.1 helix-turn-helix domain-containing protein [Niallia sp. RD1]